MQLSTAHFASEMKINFVKMSGRLTGKPALWEEVQRESASYAGLEKPALRGRRQIVLYISNASHSLHLLNKGLGRFSDPRANLAVFLNKRYIASTHLARRRTDRW